jgi:hypothetical protein
MDFNLDARMEAEAQRQSAELGGDTGDQTGADQGSGDDNNTGDTTGDDSTDGATGDDNNVSGEDQGIDNNQTGDADTSKPAGTDNASIEPQLEIISGGKIKTLEDLNGLLKQVADFDTVKKDYEDRLAKSAEFADEFEAKRNELKRNGASKEQLVTFEKLNDVADIKSLDPIEAKVMKLVLIDGFPEKLARNKVEKDYPLSTIEDEDEKELMEQELKFSSKPDVEALEALKVKVSTAGNDNALKAKVDVEVLKLELKPVLEDFTQKFSKLTTLNLNGKEGDEAVSFDLTLDDIGKKSFVTDIEAFLVDNSLPLTQENYNAAVDYARKEYVKNNLEAINQKVWAKASAHYEKFYTEKYENRGGLPAGDRKPGADSTATVDAKMQQVKEELMGGPLR